MSPLLDPKTKAVMDQSVADAEARGDAELAIDLRRIQAELVHNLDQMEERLREEGSLELVERILLTLERAVEKED